MESPQIPTSHVPRVLVTEDDEILSFLIQEALKLDGLEVFTAPHPREGLELHHRHRMDLIILDRMFADVDGLATLRALRVSGDEVPVLMLTSRSEVSDRVTGLGEGADDYMGKPFSIVELQARVRALLRRTARRGPAQPEPSQCGPFTIDWSRTLRVEREGRSLDLTPQEFRIMALLLRNPGKPLTREELLTHAWPASARPAHPKSVDVYVARLRSKLGRPEDPAWILTQGKDGYMWNADAGAVV